MSPDDHDRGPPNLIEFWEASRAWLSKRGVELYELLPERWDYLYRDWGTPTASTDASFISLPHARCIWDESSPQRAFVTTVSP